MTLKSMLRVGTALLVPFAVAACDHKADKPPPPPPPAGQLPIQDRIGGNFKGFFEASNTSDARDPQSNDLPAVNLTADPLDN